MKEPVSGYLESAYGAMSLLLGGGTGVVRVIRFKKKSISYNIDLIPADICVNATLIIARETSLLERGNCKVYNNVLSNVQKISASKMKILFTTLFNSHSKFFRRLFDGNMQYNTEEISIQTYDLVSDYQLREQ